ncbi:MAG: hypothetical protein KDA46_08525 [Parvularculaceae bacterium]|nr:hypothetical protein [Parvularculaceae bacterium]
MTEIMAPAPTVLKIDDEAESEVKNPAGILCLRPRRAGAFPDEAGTGSLENAAKPEILAFK